MGECVRHDFCAVNGWMFNIAAEFEAAEQRTVVAHGDNRGNEWQNDISLGRGGRGGLMNGGFLSPLPGLLKLGGMVSHS